MDPLQPLSDGTGLEPPAASWLMAADPVSSPGSMADRAGEASATRAAPRVLLPPLRPSRLSTTSARAHLGSQTPHACDLCRRSKAKCSGDQPCGRCCSFGKLCVYGDGKRDREKKETERRSRDHASMRRRNKDLEEALRQISISSHLNVAEKRTIQAVLAESPEEGPGTPRASSEFHGASDWQPAGVDHGAFPSDGRAEVSSFDTMYYDINEDGPSGAGAIGYLGEASEITWIQRAKKQAARTPPSSPEWHAPSAGAGEGMSLAAACYHSNGLAPTPPGDGQVDILAWPAPATALEYVTSYFNIIHPAFPLLHQKDFMAMFHQFSQQGIGDLSLIQRRWLSKINVVFAIGAKFAHLTKADCHGDENDHLIYYARARSLGLDHQNLNDPPGLHQLSCLALLGLYLVTDQQINSAWTAIGLSVRQAVALGLHLCNAAEGLADIDNEVRVRLWWSIYSLECLLGEFTGRPSCISGSDISTPLPCDCNEVELRPGFLAEKKRYPSLDRLSGKRLDLCGASRSSHSAQEPPAAESLPISTSTYFINRTLLSKITHEVLAALYCASAARLHWNDIQEVIRNVDRKLLAWMDNLPWELDFVAQIETSHLLERAALGMQYHSTRMILHRSCLCHFEARAPHESEMSTEFKRQAAGICVESARAVIGYLPDLTQPINAYMHTPWWGLLHYLCQAASVLMLEIALRAEHAPIIAEDILEDAKKVVLWLRIMSIDSVSAHKAWVVFDALLREAAPRMGGNADDVPRESPVPSDWNHPLEGHAYQTFPGALNPSLYPSSPDPQRYPPSTAPFPPWSHQRNPLPWDITPRPDEFPGSFAQSDQVFPPDPDPFAPYGDF